MKTLLLTLLMIVLLNSHAQKPFTSIGAEWHYGIGYDTHPPYIQGHYGLTSLRDTIIDTDTFSNISNEFFITSSDSFDYYFFRTGFPKKRLFKTNSRVGDTVTIDVYFKALVSSDPVQYADTFMPLRITIDSIRPVSGNVLNPNDSTRIFKFTLVDWGEIHVPPPFFLVSITGTYIHKVGQPGDFGNFLALFSPSMIMTPTLGLRCFSSLAYSYKPIGLTKPCDYSNVGLIDLTAQPKINISPNPANTFITISNTNLQSIIIFNQLGQQVFTSGNPNTTIDIKQLEYGVYFLRATDNNGIVSTGKFIKQ